MKLNVLKLLGGGGLLFSAVANPYSNSAAADRLAGQSASSLESSLIPEKLMEKLYENGIPNDVDKFMNMLADFESKSNFGFGVDKRAIYNLRAYANQVIKQSSYLDLAEKLVEKNGAWDEYAVDSRGNLYTYNDKGEIKKVHASEFDATKQMALTVGELIQLRKFNPSTVNNSDIVTSVANNVGIEKINDYIQGIIKAVGSTDDSSESYLDVASIVGKDLAKRPTHQQQLAMLELYGWVLKVGPDAIFKVKDLLKAENMNAAMQYIFSVLPNNMRTLLIARNVAEGGDYKNSNKYASDIIQLAGMMAMDVKQVHGMDYDAGINKAAGTSAGLKDLNKNLGVLELLVLGTLGQITYNLTSSKIPSTLMQLHGSGVGNLSDFNNNIIGKAPISTVMDASLGPLVDQNHVSAGNEKITSSTFDTVLYDGGPIINIWAPTDGNGDVDLELLKTFNDILKVIKNNPLLTLEDKNYLLKENGLDGQFDSLGDFHGGPNMAQFLVFTGLTSDKVIDPDVNLFADKLNKEEKEAAMNLIHRIYGLLNKGIKNKDGQYQFLTGFFERFTDLVRVPIFMKLAKNANIDVETFSNKGPIVLTPSYLQMIAYDQMRSRPQINTPSTTLLYE